MTHPSRRHFLRHLAISAPILFGARALGQEPTPPATPAAPAVELTEDDPVAMALGYKKDHTQVDATKYPMYKPENVCEACALYTGKPGDELGPCTVFQNKLVHAKGWCATFAPKPPVAPASPEAPGTPATPAVPVAPATPTAPVE